MSHFNLDLHCLEIQLLVSSSLALYKELTLFFPNELAHPYHLEESISNLKGFWAEVLPLKLYSIGFRKKCLHKKAAKKHGLTEPFIEE